MEELERRVYIGVAITIDYGGRGGKGGREKRKREMIEKAPLLSNFKSRHWRD